MITRRDVAVAAITTLALLGAAGVRSLAAQAGQQQMPALQSAVFDWNAIPATPTKVGSVRQFVKGPTATLEQLEIHVTTLNAGETSHPPHSHPNEELVIVREGTVEALVQGEWKRVGPGSVVFNASNQLHGLRNVGAGPATYYVINWTTAVTPKAGQ